MAAPSRISQERIIAALRTSWRVKDAAAKLGVPLRSLENRLHRDGIRASALLMTPGAPVETSGPSSAEVEEIRQEVEQLRAIRERPEVAPLQWREAKGRRPGVPVVVISDAHIGEVVDRDAVNGLNAYDQAICEERLHHVVKGALHLVEWSRHMFAFDEIVIAFLGDIITGEIHADLTETSWGTAIEQIRWAKRAVRQMLVTLRERAGVGRIVVPWAYGNHGRNTDKPRAKHAAEHSYEWLMGVDLADEFAGQGVDIITSTSPHVFLDIGKDTLHFAHGDDLRYSGGVLGIGLPLAKAEPVWERVRRADCHVVGHHHTFYDSERTLINGSIIGYTEYAMKRLCPPRPPVQGFFVWDASHGKTAVCRIWAEQARKDAS